MGGCIPIVIDVLRDGCGLYREHHDQLSLSSIGESGIKLVDVNRVIVVEIGYDILEFCPIQCS